MDPNGSSSHHQKPIQPKLPQEGAINLGSRTSSELGRQVVDPSAGLPQDSAIIPNIEAWLKGRTPTGKREILKHKFDDSEFGA